MSSNDKEDALRFKAKGNENFKNKRFCAAINDYTKSLGFYADPVVFSNRAQAELRADLPILAQMDCTAAIELDPNAAKAFYRRAQAFKEMKLFELALKDMEKCVELTNDKEMIAAKEKLVGKKNTQMLEMCPVERDEYLESKEDFVDIPISFDDFVEESPAVVEVQTATTSEKRVPFVPKDFHDFAAGISYLDKEPLLLAEYFLSIHPNSYHDLFDELLDDVSAALIFSALLCYLKTGRTIDNIADRLIKISQLSRFDFIMMLMSHEDREKVFAICDYLPAEEAMVVRLKYSC